MDSKIPVRTETRARRTALVVVTAAAAIWSSNALARTQPDPDCNPADTLEGLNAPIESLLINAVDHVPTDQVVSDIADIDLDTVAGDSVTPLLNLEPQVNEALREVFEADESTLGETSIPDVSTSPIAEYDDIKNLSELNEGATPADTAAEEDELSLLRRQMYRIDI